MNLKVILKDYIDFLESRGITFPEKYSFRMNDEMFQKMKLILEDVDYDFILDVIDDFYDDLKKQVEETHDKVCVKFANRIVVGDIININYSDDGSIIKSIDLIDKKKESLNIKFDLIYSIQEPKTSEELKKERSMPKKDPNKHVIKDKHKYDEFIEPDLMSTRQIQIIDKPEYVDDGKPSLSEIIFSKGSLIAVIVLALAIGAIVAVNYSIAATNNSKNNEVVCIEGYTNINGECIKSNTLTTEETTTQAPVKDALIEVVKSFKKED